VLYKLNGTTHLLCVVLPNPLTRAFSPPNAEEIGGGSPTGLMLSETINRYLNAKHMKEILLCMTLLHNHNVTFSKKFKKFLQLVAPVFTFPQLC